MVAWRPENPSEPDGEHECLFEPVAVVLPELAALLLRRYATAWLAAASLPADRIDEVDDTVELLVAADWIAADGSRVLRQRSWYTGSTFWLWQWGGDEEAALDWMIEIAALQGVNVDDDRRHGPTPWDETSRASPAGIDEAKKRSRPQ